jgi:hypothetical protein
VNEFFVITFLSAASITTVAADATMPIPFAVDFPLYSEIIPAIVNPSKMLPPSDAILKTTSCNPAPSKNDLIGNLSFLILPKMLYSNAIVPVFC